MEFCEDESVIRYHYGSNWLSVKTLKSERNSKEKVVKKGFRSSVKE